MAPSKQNIRKRDKIWDEIGTEFNQSGDEVKNKWKNIRDSYAKYQKFTKTRTGQSAKKNYKNWQLTVMEHFKPFLAFAKTNSNITEPLDFIQVIHSNEVEVTNETESDLSQHLDTGDIVKEYNNVQGDIKERQSQETPLAALVLSTSSSSSLASQTRKRSSKSDERSLSAVDTVINYLEQKKNKLSPTDMVFLGYSEAIQTFSPRRHAFVKMKIAEIITQQECLHLEKSIAKNPSGSRPSSVSPGYISTPLSSPLETFSSEQEYNSVAYSSSSSCSNVRSPE